MFELKWGKDFSIIVILTCPDCGRLSEHEASAKKAGDRLQCPCGFGVPLADDNLAEAQRLLQDFFKK